MLNHIESYIEAGMRAGKARKLDDEANAQFETRYMQRMLNLEKPEHRKQARAAFEAAYTAARGILVR